VKVTIRQLLDEGTRVFGTTPRRYRTCPLPCFWETNDSGHWECFLRVSRALVLKGESKNRMGARRGLYLELSRLAPQPAEVAPPSPAHAHEPPPEEAAAAVHLPA
jgi:hypothetical protein